MIKDKYIDDFKLIPLNIKANTEFSFLSLNEIKSLNNNYKKDVIKNNSFINKIPINNNPHLNNSFNIELNNNFVKTLIIAKKKELLFD